LQHCKPNAVLINTSRGSIWDEKAIATLLQQGKIKGIATDVFADEFNGDNNTNSLLKLANKNYNIIITPHIAGASYESMETTEDFIVAKFLNLFTV
jgi:D-3-phosphoglycerate dehydrogenase